MSKRNGLILFLALVAVFLVVNRPAYKGYFTDDDFEHLSWTRHAPLSEFVKGLLTPLFQTNNFRPVGHLFYHEEAQFFGFDFQKYLAALHALHFLNVWLLWLLARKLGARPFAAAVACVFWALHPGYFEAVWKPAYVFDVLCATFSLLSILAYAQGRWVLSLVSFWLAYKSKELGVMVPFVLACYELWFGRKRWKPLVPFFVISLSFALQALVFTPNSGDDNPYTFHFTLGAIAVTSMFYAARVFLVPYLGYLVPVAARFSRSPVIWFGACAMLLFFTPVAFLPGRIETAYCYLPFTGLALMLAGAAELVPAVAIVAALVLFAPWEYHDLRLQRRDKLGKDEDARTYVTTLQKFLAGAGPVDTFLWNGSPYGFGDFGIESAIKCFDPADNPRIHYYQHPPVDLGPNRTAILTWTQGLHKLDIVSHAPDTPDASYIDVNVATPVWQLGDGWSNPEGGYRWIAPLATARLARPAGAAHFELRVLASSTLIQNEGTVNVQASLDGQDLAPKHVSQAGWQTLEWNLPAAPAGSENLTIRCDPPFKPAGDPRTLGIAVGSLGFK